MTGKELQVFNVNGIKVNYKIIHEQYYICISNFIANEEHPEDIIRGWISNKNTIEFLGLWEQQNNSNFKLGEFTQFRENAGSNKFHLRPQKWINTTNAIGLKSKAGNGGGTYAHEDIALEFASWLSPEFKLYLITEFKRLKQKEAEEQHKLEEWQQNRWLTKINYKLHTDAIKYNILPISNAPKQYEGCIYASEAEMLNKIVFGITSKEFKEKHPTIAKKGNMRDFAEKKVLVIITNLESANAKMIREGFVNQQDRFYKLLKQANDEKKSFGITDNNLFQHNLFVSLDNKEEHIDKLQYIQESIANKQGDIDFIQNIKQAQLDLPENDKPEDIIAPFTREFKKK